MKIAKTILSVIELICFAYLWKTCGEMTAGLITASVAALRTVVFVITIVGCLAMRSEMRGEKDEQ